MPQPIQIASIEVKEGDNTQGHWKNFIFTGEDKAKASMFEPNNAGLKPSELAVGDTINAEIVLKGKYANIETYQIVGKAVLSQAGSLPPPKAEETATSPYKGKVASYQGDSPEKRASIEAQNAYSGVIELMVAKIIDSKNSLFQTALNYAASKLSLWASIGEVTTDGWIDPELEKRIRDALQSVSSPIVEQSNTVVSPYIDLLILQEQLNMLQANKVTGWGNNELLAYMSKMYKVAGSTPVEAASRLDSGQAKHFIAGVEKAVTKIEAIDRR